MLEIGDKIGDYTLARFLGKGQFGEVWLAEKHLQFSSRKFNHALKFLSNLGNEIDLKSAEAEIDTWIEASGHPNVMSVLDMFAYNEHIIIVSEYADGGSLKSWLHASGGKAPSIEKALEMMRGILRGIEHLHSRNVIHRDLKPDNILIQGNFPRITDFGISRIVSTDSLLTKVIGSPAYMSPESFEGQKSVQTDIWSAGVMFYELLTGSHPFFSDSIFGLVAVIQREEPKQLPTEIPEEIRKVVDTALQRDLGRRFQTARDMRVAVEQATYALKVRSRGKPPLSQTSGAVTEVLIDVSKFIPPAQKTEPTLDRVYKQPPKSVAPTEAFSRPEIPGNPSQDQPFFKTQASPSKENIIIETQAAPVTATQDPIESGGSIQTRDLSAPARIPQPVHPAQKKPNFLGQRATLLIGALGGGFVMVVLFFVALTMFLRSYSASESPAANTVYSPKLPKNSAAEPPSASTNPPAPDGMVYIPSGEFLMGLDADKIKGSPGDHKYESPAHTVKLGSYFMDKFEVTNEDYLKFLSATGHRPPPQWNGATYPSGKAKFPVVGIEYPDAEAYALWAGKRLPTEVEWEFAARGETGNLYPWGNSWDKNKANVESKAFKDVGSNDGKSPFGLLDMIGNAWEWTSTDFAPYAGPSNPDDQGKKVIRGGSYEVNSEYGTATYRSGWKTTGAATYAQTGFRCAKDVK